MSRFMSDRRVLATSAAVITVAIMAFLIATFPNWRSAIIAVRPTAEASPPAALPEAGKQAQQESKTQTEAATAQPAPATVPSTGDAPPSPSATTAASPSPAEPQGGAAAVPNDGVGASGAPADQASGKPAGSDLRPSFDIVRVEPTGDSVVAARAKAGDEVVLLDQGQPIARAKADANGQVAFVPPTLAPGEHSLMLSVGDPKAPGAISSQSVAVSIPAEPKTAPLVALIAPDQPTKILSGDTAAAAAAPGPAGASGPAPKVAVSTIDVEEPGGIYATGKAAPDSHCRVYLNGSFIASVTAGKDGTWSLKIKRGMKPGRYTVRVDQMQSASGQVQARAEVPFDFPTRVAGASPLLRPKPDRSAIDASAAAPTLVPPTPASGAGATASKSAPAAQPAAPLQQPASAPVQVAAAEPAAASTTAGDTASTVVAQLLTTKVVHGDSLWRISRKMLGHGVRYTQIYAANTTQIRDPKLIYPGQIFVLPQTVQ